VHHCTAVVCKAAKANAPSGAAAGHRRRSAYAVHPAFPDLPASTPLTYTLTVHACLSVLPNDRPNFEQLVVLLADISSETSAGRYADSHGDMQVLFRQAGIRTCLHCT
jgi:hypothetical protein